MADTIGTVRVELVADPSGIQRGIEQASAALTRAAVIGSAVGNVLAEAFTRVTDKFFELTGTLLEGHGDVWDRLSGDAQNAVSLISHAFDDLQDSAVSVTGEFVERLSPAFAVLIEQLGQFSEGGAAVRAVFDGVVFVFEKLIQAGIVVVAVFRDLIASLEALGAMAARLGRAIGESLAAPLSAVDAWKKAFADVGQINADAQKRIEEIWRDAGRRINEIQEGVAISADRAGGRLQHVTDEARRSFDRLAHEAQRVFEMTRTPFERLQLEIDKLDRLLRANLISLDTYERRVEHLRNQFSGFSELMRGMGQSFESAFVDAVTGARKLSDALRSLLRDLAQIAARAVFRQLFGGLFGFAPGAARSGFGASLPGFASGGAFVVGGAGGMDSQLVAFRATPGEHVSIGRDDAPSKRTADGLRVTINNYSSEQVETRQRSDNELEVIVGGLVRAELESGRTNSIFTQKYGLRPRVRSR